VVRNDLYNAHMIPGHTLARVWLEKDSLRIVFLDEDWLADAVKDGRVALTHVEAKGWLVLTAPASGLRTFILKYGEDKKAFPLQSAEGRLRAKSGGSRSGALAGKMMEPARGIEAPTCRTRLMRRKRLWRPGERPTIASGHTDHWDHCSSIPRWAIGLRICGS